MWWQLLLILGTLLYPVLGLSGESQVVCEDQFLKIVQSNAVSIPKSMSPTRLDKGGRLTAQEGIVAAKLKWLAEKMSTLPMNVRADLEALIGQEGVIYNDVFFKIALEEIELRENDLNYYFDNQQPVPDHLIEEIIGMIHLRLRSTFEIEETLAYQRFPSKRKAKRYLKQIENWKRASSHFSNREFRLIVSTISLLAIVDLELMPAFRKKQSNVVLNMLRLIGGKNIFPRLHRFKANFKGDLETEFQSSVMSYLVGPVILNAAGGLAGLFLFGPAIGEFYLVYQAVLHGIFIVRMETVYKATPLKAIVQKIARAKAYRIARRKAKVFRSLITSGNANVFLDGKVNKLDGQSRIARLSMDEPFDLEGFKQSLPEFDSAQERLFGFGEAAQRVSIEKSVAGQNLQMTDKDFTAAFETVVQLQEGDKVPRKLRSTKGRQLIFGLLYQRVKEIQLRLERLKEVYKKSLEFEALALVHLDQSESSLQIIEALKNSNRITSEVIGAYNQFSDNLSRMADFIYSNDIAGLSTQLRSPEFMGNLETIKGIATANQTSTNAFLDEMVAN